MSDHLSREAESYRVQLVKAHNNGIERVAMMLEEEAAKYVQNPGAHQHLLDLAKEAREKKS